LHSPQVVQFSNLSSGEKVLVQLAISSFRYDSNLININRPKLLLLDEMDASLHPEMVSTWLAAIKGPLVEEQGIHCILTTHSPTTVALAPEDAFFEMKDGRSGLTKITKQQALNKLTVGVPTLSIDFSGRRQVFAEDSVDAEIYEATFSLMKRHINCTRDLNFLGTGLKDKDGGMINSGCEIIKKIVPAMVKGGNRSVFGLLDYDNKNKSDGRIKVLAEGRRYAVENLVLDPLLVCLKLMDDKKPPKEINDIAGFVEAKELPPEGIQRLVDAVQNSIVHHKAGDKVLVSYLGGASANVFKEYLEMNGHRLEFALAEQFPSLKEWTHERTKEPLKINIVKNVLSEHIMFCPIELKELFEDIANCEVE